MKIFLHVKDDEVYYILLLVTFVKRRVRFMGRDKSDLISIIIEHTGRSLKIYVQVTMYKNCYLRMVCVSRR